MDQITVKSDDGKREVVIREQDGRYTARLYVNSGETPTFQHARCPNLESALDFADRALGRKPETRPDFIRKGNSL